MFGFLLSVLVLFGVFGRGSSGHPGGLLPPFPSSRLAAAAGGRRARVSVRSSPTSVLRSGRQFDSRRYEAAAPAALAPQTPACALLGGIIKASFSRSSTSLPQVGRGAREGAGPGAGEPPRSGVCRGHRRSGPFPCAPLTPLGTVSRPLTGVNAARTLRAL